MFYWLLERVLRRGFKSRRGIYRLEEMDQLARSGTAGWILAQEKVRLDYLNAKEVYQKERSWRSFQRCLERLLQLQSTNAIIQSLINEHLLEQLLARSANPAASEPAPAARRCA